MKLANAIEGGITGAATLSLLQEALHKIDQEAPRPFLYKSGILNELKNNNRKDAKSISPYFKLTTELLTNVASFAMVGLGKKKNAIWRGALLGTAAGLVSAFLQQDKEADEENKSLVQADEVNGKIVVKDKNGKIKKKVLTILLYAAGGLLAGTAVKEFDWNNKKLRKKILRSKLIKGKLMKGKLKKSKS